MGLNVGAILGSARCYIILKQTQKAKTQLKQVIGYSWSLEEADYIQKCLYFNIIIVYLIFLRSITSNRYLYKSRKE